MKAYNAEANALSRDFCSDCKACSFMSNIEKDLRAHVIGVLSTDQGLCLDCVTPKKGQNCSQDHFEMEDDPQGGGYPPAISLLFGDRMGMTFLTDQKEGVVSFEDSIAQGLDGS